MFIKNQVVVSKKEKFSIAFVLDDCDYKTSLVQIQKFIDGTIIWDDVKNYRLPYGSHEIPKEVRQYFEESGIKPVIKYQEYKNKKNNKIKIVL
jgi:hypothetical protein